MNPKVRIYNALPDVLKTAVTQGYIALRRRREATAARQWSNTAMRHDQPRVLYITGFPRSGTTLLKYYLGDFPGLTQTEFNPVGFFHTWERAQNTEDVLVDKSNHYIYGLPDLFKGCGNGAAVCCIIRDPRDIITSLLRYPESREVPRTVRFWDHWYRQHRDFLAFAEQSGHGNRIYALRYEDLVEYPTAAKYDALVWLGLSPESDAITKSYTNANPYEGRPDSVDEHQEVSRFGLQKWRNDPVQESQRAVVYGWKNHFEAHRLMRTLGYTDTGYASPPLKAENFRFFTPGSPHEDHP